MKNLLILFLSLIILFLILSCDDKAKVKYVAQSSYDKLATKYNNLKVQNQKLNRENEMLKHDLKKYKNGFKSMYQ